MEATLTELYSSLRALTRSNKELEEALDINPGDADFIEALEENWSVMRKKRALAKELVTDLKRQGVNIDLAEDIRQMDLPDLQKASSTQPEQPNTTSDGGIYL